MSSTCYVKAHVFCAKTCQSRDLYPFSLCRSCAYLYRAEKVKAQEELSLELGNIDKSEEARKGRREWLRRLKVSPGIWVKIEVIKLRQKWTVPHETIPRGVESFCSSVYVCFKTKNYDDAHHKEFLLPRTGIRLSCR